MIVPVYNGEKYIGQCLDAVLRRQNLSFDSLELICIDDCSSDETPNILQEFSNADQRLKVILLNKHAGAGAARNVGLKIARGKFLHFVDSDDLVIANSYSAWLDVLEGTGADFSCAKFKRVDFPTKKELDIRGCSFNEKVHVLKLPADNSILINDFVAPWNKLYRKSFVMQNGIRFDETMVRNDRSFFISCILKAKKVAYSDGCFYEHFVNRSGSLVFQSGCYFGDVVLVFKNVFQISKNSDSRTFANIMEVQFRDLFFWCQKCAGTEFESKALKAVQNFLKGFCAENMILERCNDSTVDMVRGFESMHIGMK